MNANRNREPRAARSSDDQSRRSIGELFYETRVLQGRRWSLRRFGAEALEGRVEPVMLSYIEKGERLPSEDLVRQLAAFRREDAQPLLARLWRERIRRAVAREVEKALQAEPPATPVDDGTLAVRLSRAMAALPDDGSWIPYRRWRAEFRRDGKRRRRSASGEAALDDQVEATLRRHGLVEVVGARVRRKARHLQAEGARERRAVALQFADLFAKGLIDRVALAEVDTGTYLRNHYLNIERSRIAEFHAELDAVLRSLTERFAATPSRDTEFMNVLTTATPQ